MSEWHEVALGDIAEIKHGWPFKSQLFFEDLTGRPIVVSIGNFNYTGGFRFESTATKEYRGDYPKEFELQPGDVLVIMTCQTPGGEILGVPGRIPDDGRLYLHNQRMGKVVVTRPDLTCLDYLYWVFLWRELNQELVASASGTKIVHTAPSRIERFRFSLPSLVEQQGIAEVLWALEDKIELNRRLAGSLETLATAIFRSWFIDFDPVWALCDGRQPAGISRSHAQKLFPAHVEQTELGPIPAGWRVFNLPDIFHVNPERSLAPGTIAPYLPMAAMPTRGHAPEKWHTRPAGSGLRFIDGDTLVARITPCLENGKTAFVDFLGDGIVGCGSTEYIVLRPKRLPLEFAYLLARTDDFRDFLVANMTGSSGRQRVPVDALAHYRLPVPPSPSDALLGSAFGAAVSPLFSQVSANARENRTLIALRDSLLPRLLSGEIRLKEAEKAVEQVV